MATIDTGRAAEIKAASFLEKNGYAVLERNVKSRLGEIDLVAEEKGVICFIEVRSRRGLSNKVLALESVDARKQVRLSRLALSYLKSRRWLDRRARFDVVAVSSGQEGEEFTLIRDAFPLAERYA